MPRTTRRQRNQALFREANERVADIAAHFDELAGDLGPAPEYAFVCECAKTGCTASVALSVATYVAVRAEPEAFVVARGHERPLQEDVLWSGDEFVVVRPKRNGAGLRLASIPAQRSDGRNQAAAASAGSTHFSRQATRQRSTFFHGGGSTTYTVRAGSS